MPVSTASSHDSLHIEELCPGIDHLRFERTPGWQTGHNDERVSRVLSMMKDKGALSVVQVSKPETTISSPTGGIAAPLDLIKRLEGPFLAVNGGFFIHLPYLFRTNEGHLMTHDKLNFTVGPTSATEETGKYVPIPEAYADELKKREMTDNTFLHTGPSLNQLMEFEDVSFKDINTPLGRFRYFAMSPEGEKIASPVFFDLKKFDEQYEEWAKDEDFQGATTMQRKTEEEWLADAMKKQTIGDNGELAYASRPPANAHIKSVWASIPGNLSHLTEPNERSGVSRHKRAWVFAAYNSKRNEGLTMNEFSSLFKEVLALLGHTIGNDDDIWANDGGPSIFQIFKDKDGSIKLLAQGDLSQQKRVMALDPSTMRKVPNAMVAFPKATEGEEI
ncbi:hypothetical protein FY134_27485 (plasmid) [Agrobacterium fabrum]|uniref:hypothetical protein n=1 Tax=Agrobacterium fabrum TaxID=1176649 RepID=UPI0013A69927|nr:hypothetical protein [Agrobacterium fabrum]NSZ14673.1 hypothetical protein [Agrobacterium fabrum]UXT61431.1 hypothetical protein FY134_27485 [Agrobacterium fabrum]